MADAVTSNGTDEGGRRDGDGGRGRKVPRLPRWTRQEILVLIQGKKVAESRGGGGRGRSRINHMGGVGGSGTGGGLVGGSVVEPKWATVASYCRRHGVHRAPVQCRKRWSNLAGDFKKIREWEALLRGGSGGGGESYWTMRNDVRRERKLPGFFDREVYDILGGAVELRGTGDGDDLEEERKDDGVKPEEEDEEEEAAAAAASARSPQSHPSIPSPRRPPPPAVVEAAMVEEDGGEPVPDSAGAAEDDELFSDSDHNDAEEGGREDNNGHSPAAGDHPPGASEAATPLPGTKPDGSFYPTRPPEPGFTNGRHPTPETVTILNEDISQGTTKRRHGSVAESSNDTSIHSQLIRIFDQNNRMLAAQLEAHNVNCQLEREERKEMINSVIRVIGKIASALEKVADKL